MDPVYVIRWDRVKTYGAEYVKKLEFRGAQYVFISELRLGVYGAGCLYGPDPGHAVRFDSWAAAAAAAAFIIHHIDDRFDDALEVVEVNS